MVAAGVGNDTLVAFIVGERRDFVVGATKFEGADGLLVLGLEKQARAAPHSRGQLSPHVFGPFDQAGAEGDSVQYRLSRVEIGQ